MIIKKRPGKKHASNQKARMRFHPGFCVCRCQIAVKYPKRVWRADLSSTAFGKSSAVYGHIDENGRFVRKRPARKMAITDKMGKNGRLSVKNSDVFDPVLRTNAPKNGFCP